MKRGQLTLFLILALILIAAIMVGVFLRKQIVNTVVPVERVKSVTLQQEVDSVYSIVEDCLEKVGRDGAHIIMANGGFLILDDKNSIELYARRIPKYISYGSENVPSVESMESDVVRYVELMLGNCIDLESFEGFSVSELGTPEIEAGIKDNEVSLELEYKLKISKAGNTERINNFNAIVGVDMLTPYNEALEVYGFIKTGVEDTEIASFVSEKDYSFASETLFDATAYALKFDNMIIDDKVNVDDSVVIWTFAIEEKAEEVNVEELDDDVLGYILTFPELFEEYEEVPDEFEDIDLEELGLLDDSGETGGIDVA